MTHFVPTHMHNSVHDAGCESVFSQFGCNSPLRAQLGEMVMWSSAPHDLGALAPDRPLDLRTVSVELSSFFTGTRAKGMSPGRRWLRPRGVVSLGRRTGTLSTDSKELMKAIWNGAVLAESDDIRSSWRAITTSRRNGSTTAISSLAERESLRPAHWKGTASYFHVDVDGKRRTPMRRGTTRLRYRMHASEIAGARGLLARSRGRRGLDVPGHDDLAGFGAVAEGAGPVLVRPDDQGHSWEKGGSGVGCGSAVPMMTAIGADR